MARLLALLLARVLLRLLLNAASIALLLLLLLAGLALRTGRRALLVVGLLGECVELQQNALLHRLRHRAGVFLVAEALATAGKVVAESTDRPVAAACRRFAGHLLSFTFAAGVAEEDIEKIAIEQSQVEIVGINE